MQTIAKKPYTLFLQSPCGYACDDRVRQERALITSSLAV
jgi:hypothetical protein